MQKKQLSLIAAAVMILAIAIYFVTTRPSSPFVEKETAKEIDNNTILSYHSLHITDAYDELYEDELDIQVDTFNTSELFNALKEAETIERKTGGLPWYAIEFQDADGKIISRLIVYPDRTLQSDDGIFYKRTGGLEDFLTALETKYDIDFSILERKPGKAYFSLAHLAEQGNLYEFTENNFIKGLNETLTKEQLTGISSLLLNYDGGFEKDASPEIKEPSKYRLSLYTSEGSELYVFDITENKDVYINAWKINITLPVP